VTIQDRDRKIKYLVNRAKHDLIHALYVFQRDEKEECVRHAERTFRQAVRLLDDTKLSTTPVTLA
jgi:hypothetical protein